jgi:hypothetical protein
MKPLSDKDRKLYLENKITYDEVYEVINKMKGSSPGPNGLTLGFYKKYFPFFGVHFVEILNDNEKNLSDTFNKINIKLIPKNNKKTKSINDLRPISLTNYEYRIFTKVLANRLHKISNILIGEHQTCGILGRRMNDNIILLRDLIEDAKRKKKKLNVISVDQKKAFDSISHNYLFGLLENLNMGDFMYKNIKRLYVNSYATIIVNKLRSEKIKIKSSIKQGCALSMMLYVIAIEELLLRIKKNENIKGYEENILKKYELKASV